MNNSWKEGAPYFIEAIQINSNIYICQPDIYRYSSDIRSLFILVWSFAVLSKARSTFAHYLSFCTQFLPFLGIWRIQRYDQVWDESVRHFHIWILGWCRFSRCSRSIFNSSRGPQSTSPSINRERPTLWGCQLGFQSLSPRSWEQTKDCWLPQDTFWTTSGRCPSLCKSRRAWSCFQVIWASFRWWIEKSRSLRSRTCPTWGRLFQGCWAGWSSRFKGTQSIFWVLPHRPSGWVCAASIPHSSCPGYATSARPAWRLRRWRTSYNTQWPARIHVVYSSSYLYRSWHPGTPWWCWREHWIWDIQLRFSGGLPGIPRSSPLRTCECLWR